MTWPTKKLGEIGRMDIKGKVLIALDCLYKNDAFLLEVGAHERSISHKLAEYLQVEFPGWHVDCEYNRHGLGTKTLPRECNGRDEERVFPDIVIHHRNTNDNLLVIEIKPQRTEHPDVCDDAKLAAFTEQNGEYKYRFGLYIGFDTLSEPQMIWYRSGRASDM